MRHLLKLTLIVALLVGFALPAFAQTGESIAPGDTVTGTLTAAEPSATYTLDAEAGQSVNIRLASGDFDAYLTLMDADGNVLSENDDNSGTDSGILSYVLPQATGYSILVESYGQHGGGGAETGDYSLSVTEQQIERIEYSQTINGQLTTEEAAKDYVFTGQQGDVVVITEVSSDFDSYLRLLDANGNELMTNDDSGGALDSMIGPFTLPTTGSYTIRAGSLSGDVTGAFTLTLSKTDVTAITSDEPLEISLTPSDRTKYFTFEGTSGELISISVDSNNTVDTSLSLNDPNNYSVISDDDSGSGFDPEIYQQLLSTTGMYTVVLQVANPGTGKVTMSIVHTPPPSLDDGVQTIAFSDSQTSRAVMFTATAGESVRLNLHALNGQTGSPSVTIMLGDSTIATASGSTISDLSFSFTAPDDGNAVIQISDYSYTSLSYEVSLAHETE